MAKVLCALYDDPVDGYPKAYARDGIPTITRYDNGQIAPTPHAIDFVPGELLGCVSGELGLRSYLEGLGHELVVTSDKDGADSVFERELPDADIVISQPFWPAYLTKGRLEKAPKLKLALTAGIGSDHVDLEAAIAHGATVAAGRIGLAILKRLNAFGVHLHYNARHQLAPETEAELGLVFHRDVEDMVGVCDVVVRALDSGRLAGYAGDVWYPQPAPADHPWRSIPHQGMTPHMSGTSLSGQARYAAGTREILESWFENRPIRDEYLIVDAGRRAGTDAASYTV